MSKRKGTNAERELVRTFWKEGWAAVRVAGSGSSHYPSPDILVGREGRRLAIEAKITVDEKKYFPQDEINQLNYFARTFGAEAWIAVKFNGTPWAFFSLEDLCATTKSFVISKTDVDLKGLSFEDVIGN
ncbi:Holliday junction resolvase [Candidatus Woesearchaeota archaeon]|nr:Holliday junction resolvase [Candidatus Woesearchaeota archaeon]